MTMSDPFIDNLTDWQAPLPTWTRAKRPSTDWRTEYRARLLVYWLPRGRTYEQIRRLMSEAPGPRVPRDVAHVRVWADDMGLPRPVPMAWRTEERKAYFVQAYPRTALRDMQNAMSRMPGASLPMSKECLHHWARELGLERRWKQVERAPKAALAAVDPVRPPLPPVTRDGMVSVAACIDLSPAELMETVTLDDAMAYARRNGFEPPISIEDINGWRAKWGLPPWRVVRKLPAAGMGA